MYNFEKKIKELLLKNELTIENLAYKLGVSPATLHNLFKKNNTNTDLLKKISDVFEVPVSSFFDEEKNTNSGVANGSQINGNYNKVSIKVNEQANEIEKLNQEVSYLKELLKQKDEIINLLKNK
ncbi:MAG: helix-turn-helix domain-containing protein [Bacteroidales bacterium]|nr:helix-turn-helix domain-containing protein [Bacteroidales bacterium]